MFKLQFKDNPKRSLWLVGEKVTLGSHADNAVVLDGLGIDEFHAELLIEPDRLVLKSRPGSCIVNDLPVDDNFEIGANDELRIGKERLLIIDPQRQPQPKADTTAPNLPAQKAADWTLVPDHPKLKALDFSIRDRVILGRSRDCQLSVPYKLLSREHAEFWIENGGLYLRDLGSSNGSFVNGKRIEEARLVSGDKVAFAKLVFAVQGPEPRESQPDKSSGKGAEMDRTIIRPAIDLQAELAAQEASRMSRSIELGAVAAEPVLAERDNLPGRGRGPLIATLSVLLAAAGIAVWFLGWGA